MRSGWTYRLGAVSGAAVLTCLAVLLSNLHVVQAFFTMYTPLFWRLDPMLLSGTALTLALVLNTLVVLAVFVPLYKPRPRRALDTVFLAQKRVIVAVFALATLGYFNYSYRLPRTTLAITGGILFVTFPMWFAWIRQRNVGSSDRVILVGDDADQMRELVVTTDLPIIGCVCPASVNEELGGAIEPSPDPVIADGGVFIRRLGGLSRIEDVLVNYEIDTAVFAFKQTDRGEFFGALDTCYEHGIGVKVHRRFADAVITDGSSSGELVDVAIEPWDVQDYLVKRAFDVGFSIAGLVALAPLMALIAVAIKLDDGGPIFYRQERTAGFGESFMVYKFRTMTVAEASPVPTEDAERVTRIGASLRRTHLDEIPQLFAILMGRMSVVGPRAVWVEEEDVILADVEEAAWRKRWYVKPGLTGLAQINGIDSANAEGKLRYDLEYIRRQSFWLDVRIVLRQMWRVIADLPQ